MKKNLLAATLVGLALVTTAACVGTAPDADIAAAGDESQPTVVRYTNEDLAALSPGEYVVVDLTDPSTGYVVEYADASLLSKVRVRSADSEYVLSDRMTELGVPARQGLQRMILASDPELRAELAQEMSGEAQAQAQAPSQDGIGEASQELRMICFCEDWGDIIICDCYIY